MKSFVSFLLGIILATGFWFLMGYLKVEPNLIEEFTQKKKHTEEPGSYEEIMAEVEAIERECDLAENTTERPMAVEQPATVEPKPEAKPSIVGHWRMADPVCSDDADRMLVIDEYGVFKAYRSVRLSISNDYVYSVKGDVLTYKYTATSHGDHSFRFKVSNVNGKDYLEIFGDPKFGGKWVRSR